MKSTSDSLSLFDDVEEVKKEIQSPFLGRKVVIEGVFHSLKKDVLKAQILRLGGEVISGDVTKKVHYFVIGDNVPSDKMEKYNKLCFDGFNIKMLTEIDVMNILNGEGSQYCVPKENVKNLHITIEHYNKKHVCYLGTVKEPSGREYFQNPLYGKNLYLGDGIIGDRMILSQMLGLVGVFSGGGLCDSTQIIVLSQSAYEALQKGEVHPELTLIQDTYNRGLAQWYDYLLTTEEEMLSWYKDRIDLCQDSVCKELYKSFIESKNNE